jgi:chaperonin GroES
VSDQEPCSTGVYLGILLGFWALRQFQASTVTKTSARGAQVTHWLGVFEEEQWPVTRKGILAHQLHQAGEPSMNVRPLHDRVIVRRLDEGEQKIGGIIIPDTAKEKPQQGQVIAAGNGKAKDVGKRIPLDVKAGDRILFGKYSGQEITLDGEEYLIMKEDEVLAVMEGQTKKTLAVVNEKAQKKKKKK